MDIEERIAGLQAGLSEYLDSPIKINDLEIEEQLDIISGLQLFFELKQALVRRKHSEHSADFMEAHADVNYWKNKLMNTKVKARILIANKERGM
jgi:hypothetical protein